MALANERGVQTNWNVPVSVPTFAALPSSAPIGVIIRVEDTGSSYQYSGTGWVLFGAIPFQGVADARILTDGSMTNGSAILTSASAGFVAADRGKVVLVAGAAAAGLDIAGTILAVISSTQVQLSVSAGATVNGLTWAFGTDNTPTITAAMTAASGTGATLTFSNGFYMFGPSAGVAAIDCSLFDTLTLSGYGATFIVANPGAGGRNFFGGGSTLGPNLALNADVVVNQRTFQVAVGSPISVGQTVTLNAGELASIYKVVAVAGASPQTVTVDRVILFPYLLAAGARVNVVTHLVTRLFFQGITFVGNPGDSYIKIRNITNSFFRDLTFLPTISFAAVNALIMSLASYNVGADNIVINGPTAMTLASCEQCWVTRFSYIGVTSSPFAAANGFSILNSANSGLQDFEINGALAAGIVIDQLASTAGIPFDVGATIANGFIGGCAQQGIIDRGWYTLIDTVLIIGNGVGNNFGGILIDASSENPKISRCRILNNGSVGISNNAGIATGTGATIFDCFISNNVADVASGVSGIVSQGPLLYIIGCQIIGRTGIAAGAFCLGWSDQGFTFGCTTIVDDCDLLVSGTSTGASIVQTTGSPTSIISNTRLRFNGGGAFVGSGINNLNGKMQLDNIQIKLSGGTVPAQGLATAAGTLTRIDDNCNFEGCTTPISMGGFCNISIPGSANANSVTLNGTTPVNYGFTDTRSSDRVQLILRTRGGTPGNGAVLVAITPGTGISLAGNAAGVNDVYDVVIR